MKKEPKKFSCNLENDVYYEIKKIADQRNESMGKVVNRILKQYCGLENIVSAQDILIANLQRVLRSELKKTENRLATLAAKSAITGATNENLTLYLLKKMQEPNIQMVKDAARKRGVAYVKQPLEEIMMAYEDEGEK